MYEKSVDFPFHKYIPVCWQQVWNVTSKWKTKTQNQNIVTNSKSSLKHKKRETLITACMTFTTCVPLKYFSAVKCLFGVCSYENKQKGSLLGCVSVWVAEELHKKLGQK